MYLYNNIAYLRIDLCFMLFHCIGNFRQIANIQLEANIFLPSRLCEMRGGPITVVQRS